MSKRTVFTTLTALPANISRETVRETLHDHLEMIDLNPLVEERHPIKPPNNSSAEEYHCVWYEMTDKVQYLPGGLMSGKVSYNACFHDLENGLQTHVYAPLGLHIRGKWTLGGTLPGEPIEPMELGLGAPMQGLWLREDVDMKCNILMTSFVKKTLKKAHSKLVDRLLVKAQIVDAAMKNQQLANQQLTASLRSKSNYGGSDYDTASIRSNGFNSSGYNLPQLAQSPPLSDHPAFRDRSNEDDGLTPRPLSFRSGSASYNGSQTTGPTSRSSVQNNALGINEGNRVSWNDLHAVRTPGQSQAYQQGQQQHLNGYSRSSPSFQAAELHSDSRNNERGLKSLPQQGIYTTYHAPSQGAVELE